MKEQERSKRGNGRKAERIRRIEPPLRMSLTAQRGEETRRIEGIAQSMADLREFMNRAMNEIWAWGDLVATQDVPFQDGEMPGSPRALMETFLREEQERHGDACH